jgi:predicted transcriptional regulator
MGKQTGLGDQELEVLRYITDHAPVTVREVAEDFGERMGLARTTILTMMERLRKKGHLIRRKPGSTFEYLPAVSKQDLMRGLVHDFVEKTLGGSLTPFVAYLTDKQGLSDSEMSDLSRLVAKLRLENKEG